MIKRLKFATIKLTKIESSVNRFMYQLYNTQKEITSNIKQFLLLCFPDIRKTQLNIIPYIVFGMICAKACAASSIATKLKDDFCFIQLDSITKRIRRFFNNALFCAFTFYNKFIKYIISNYNVKHSNQKVHIIFDHSYSHENYTILMFSMRIGKQGIPIYFECFKGINEKDAFTDETIIKGIKVVDELFKDTNFNLVFLADRWFNSENILKYIDDLGRTFCIRLKSSIKVSVFDKKRKRYVTKNACDLKSRKNRGTYYNNVYLYSDSSFKCNITVGKYNDVSEAWIVATNGNCNEAIRDYSHRFGGIETIFKNLKSNGFNLEKINNCNLKAFTNMFCLLCFSVTWLIIIGSDYIKNTNCYKDIKINSIKKCNGKNIRVISIFKLGFTLFEIAFNSLIYIRIPYKFILYDI